MRKVKLCAVQMAISPNSEENIRKASEYVRKAHQDGANVILLSELFLTPYFCQKENYDFFDLAIENIKETEFYKTFSNLARELEVVIPLSFFEKSGVAYYNSIIVIDADGSDLGVYRKTHIPTGECYEEKFYFTPGDTGFKVFNTKYLKLGIGICWDQWFPETARCLTLMGAETLLFPTAIGSEPVLPIDSKCHWQNTMCGHAAANIIPVVASNRVGKETIMDSSMTFYGSSFIANEEGSKVCELNREEEGYIIYEFDIDALNKKRVSWGVFRDRRPNMYEAINYQSYIK